MLKLGIHMNGKGFFSRDLKGCQKAHQNTLLVLSWTSYQKRNFRSPCHWCGNNPKMLAADATRIGICFKNTNIMPLENFDSSAAEIITKNKRFDRFFLPRQSYWNHYRPKKIDWTENKRSPESYKNHYVIFKWLFSITVSTGGTA